LARTPLPLDRNAKARITTLARALMRRTEKGKHYGQITAKATARLWDADAHGSIAVLGHPERVLSAAFSPDGKRVVTGSSDGTARLWDVFVDTQELISAAKMVAPRCLTAEQRQASFLLKAEPPAWCIEMAKWPYQTAAWKAWLVDERAGKNSLLPATR
jgi:hypothetical protein